MYRQHHLQRTSANRRWLLETDVSIIDSTPQVTSIVAKTEAQIGRLSENSKHLADAMRAGLLP